VPRDFTIDAKDITI
jgi:protein subunit release factor A